jgi:hypothetical protein
VPINTRILLIVQVFVIPRAICADQSDHSS